MNYEIKGLNDWKDRLDGGKQHEGPEEWAERILAQHGETDLEWAREFQRAFWEGIHKVETPLYEIKKN